MNNLSAKIKTHLPYTVFVSFPSSSLDTHQGEVRVYLLNVGDQMPLTDPLLLAKRLLLKFHCKRHPH